MNALSLYFADVHLLAGALLAVILLALALLRQPAHRMALAKSTLAALALLAALRTVPGWSLIYLGAAPETAQAPAAQERSPIIPPPVPTTKLIPTENVDRIPAPTPAPVPREPVIVAPAAPSVLWTERAIPIAVLIYLAGCLAVTTYLAAGAVYARRLRNRATFATDELQTLLANVAASSTPPTLLISAEVPTPVALGVRRPAIILPAALLPLPLGEGRGEGEPSSGSESKPAPDETIAPILAHECAHIAHGDLRTLAAARLLLILLWPQPLYWLLRRIIRRDQETLADAAAAQLAGRVPYAEQLLTLARTASASPRAARPPRLAGAVGLWEGPSQLKRRIATLLDEKLTILRAASRRWRVGTALVALAAAALLSLVTLQREAPAQAAAPGTGAASAPQTETQPSEAQPPTKREPPAWARPEPNVFHGLIVDEAGKPLPGVQLTLVRYEGNNGADGKQIATQTSAADGTFRFENVVDIAKEFPDGLPDEYLQQFNSTFLAVVCRAPHRATATENDLMVNVARQSHGHRITMQPAASLRGRITDEAGKPVAGAKVSAGFEPVILGFDMGTAKTDAGGNYLIEDIAVFDAAEEQRKLEELKKKDPAAPLAVSTYAAHLPMLVQHPNFANTRVDIPKIPGDLNVTLSPAAVIEGTVVLREPTGQAKPAAEVTINLSRQYPENPTKAPLDEFEYQTVTVKADANGNYRIPSLPPGVYAVAATAPGWVGPALQDINAPASQTTHAPALTLTRGGTVRFKLTDADTGQPLPIADKAVAWVAPHERPTLRANLSYLNSGPVTFAKSVGEMHLAAGEYEFMVRVPDATAKNTYWVSTNFMPPRTPTLYKVVEGQVVEVTVPMKKQAPMMAQGAAIITMPASGPNEGIPEVTPATPPSDSATPNLDFHPATPPADGPPTPASDAAPASSTGSPIALPANPYAAGPAAAQPIPAISATAPAIAYSAPADQSNVNLAVQCVDENGRPLEDVWVELYQYFAAEWTRECPMRMASKTGSGGRKDFGDVIQFLRGVIPGGLPAEGPVEPGQCTFVVVAYAPGRATAIEKIDAASLLKKDWQTLSATLVLPKAAELTGRVVDPEGRPVKDAIVRLDEHGLADGLHSDQFHYAVTNANGAFTLTDVAPFDGALTGPAMQAALKATGRASLASQQPTSVPLLVTHGIFATMRYYANKVPGSIEIRLERPAVITGTAVYEGSNPNDPASAAGQPASGSLVLLAPIEQRGALDVRPDADPIFARSALPPGAGQYYIGNIRTDAQGWYRFPNAPAGAYRAVVVGEHVLVATKIDTRSGADNEAPAVAVPLNGFGVARIHVVDDATGKPLEVSEEAALYFTVKSEGPKPWPPGPHNIPPMTKEGVADMRMPPGDYTLTFRRIFTAGQELPYDPAGEGARVTITAGKITEATLRVKPSAPNSAATASPDSGASLHIPPTGRNTPYPDFESFPSVDPVYNLPLTDRARVLGSRRLDAQPSAGVRP